MAWRGGLVAGLWLFGIVSPVLACGPFLYDNADLDQFSLLEPGMLNSAQWTPFLAYSSPAYGHETEPGEAVVQYVYQPDRLPMTAPEDVSNLVYDDEPGEDPVSVEANELWWQDYFKTVRRRVVTLEEVQSLLYEASRPSWLVAADRKYLDQLLLPASDSKAYLASEAAAADAKLPVPLRHRHLFWAVRSLALAGGTGAAELFRQYCPGPATDLPLARAQGWAASSLVETDPEAARALWVDLLVRWPALRAQTFSSLLTLPEAAWSGALGPDALLARFFTAGRDFSPETLAALSAAEHSAGMDGTRTETMFYSMAEQIEREAGVFALFGLVDPHEAPPRGLFTSLIDRAEALVTNGTQPSTRAWWLVASYLCLFDGDPTRAARLLSLAQGLPARNTAQERQGDLIAALITMDAECDSDWSVGLQTQVVRALAWGQSLDGVGHNRGLYHSVAVLAAQKYLARGHNPEAALAFGLVQTGPWSNPYRLQTDDGFWATGFPSNNAVNLLMDALMSDADLEAWKTLLAQPPASPLAAHLVAHPFLSGRDITWWQAHRALRRGEGGRALALLNTLGGDGSLDSSVFPRRSFAYSLDLDPLDAVSGRGMRTVGPRTLAAVMARIEDDARTTPSARTLLAQGEFWLSLQLSGLPLLFAQPPRVISFVGGNFELYGYDGRDANRSTAVVGDFPLGRPTQTDDWTRRLSTFYREEYSTLSRARRAFEAVVALGQDRDAEFRALLFLQAIDHDRYEGLSDGRYDSLALAEEFRSTCEAFQ